MFNTLDEQRHEMLEQRLVVALKWLKQSHRAKRFWPSVFILNVADHTAVGVGQNSFPNFQVLPAHVSVFPWSVSDAISCRRDAVSLIVAAPHRHCEGRRGGG